MKCQKCGYSVPEDSEFCQYCGTHLEPQSAPDVFPETVDLPTDVALPPAETVVIEPASEVISEVTPPAPKAVPIEKHEPATESVASVSAPASKNAEGPANNEKHTFCKKCGSAIDPITKKCSGCGKQYFRAKTTVPIVLLSVLLAASIGLNVMQHMQGKEAIETYTTQKKTIEKLENEVSNQKSLLSSQKKKIESLKTTSGYFDTICKELSAGNIGYAASNFKASESVIIVDKNETNRKFTLTANWTNGGTVSVDYSGFAAWVNFDNDSWTTSTKMTIEPWQKGVTAVTFSNDVDSKTFKVLIIVTD